MSPSTSVGSAHMVLPLTEELATALARCFADGKGPSHLELDELFGRFDVDEADPRHSSTDPVGKEVRIRVVLGWAVEAGGIDRSGLVHMLVARMRARGCFDSISEHFAGAEAMRALERAFEACGFVFGDGGRLSPLVLTDIDSERLRPYLETTIQRIQRSGSDAPLLVNEAKNLLESTARYVLDDLGFGFGDGSFNALLHLARERINLLPQQVDASSEPGQVLQRIYDGLWKVASAINDLRRKGEGLGHGQSQLPQLDAEAARAVVQASALMSQLMLEALDRQHGRLTVVAGH